TKILTTATGGMITTRNPELAAFGRSVRHHGQGAKRDTFERLGNDWCMSEVHAVLGLAQLKRVDEYVAHRRRLIDRYRQQLNGVPWLSIPSYPARFGHAYYKFPVLLDEALNRNLFRETLEQEFGIENGTIYDPPCHLQPALRDVLRLPAGTFPEAERTLARQLC